MELKDITMHSNSELSLLVFNDEYLYNIRNDIETLWETINNTYRYTEDQANELLEDLLQDSKEGA